MVQFCQERNLKPYIVLPPVHKELSSRLSDSFIKNYVYDFIETAINDKTIVLDYFNNALFHKDEYFQNSYYMNSIGAKVFTEKVLKDLNANGKTLIIADVTAEENKNLVLSARNIPSVKLLLPSNLNVKDLVEAETIIATESAINSITERLAK